jgi:hypothetical protein
MKCLPKDLMNEIKEKMDLVNHRKYAQKYSFMCNKRKIRSIKKNAQIESYRIEHPTLPLPHNIPKNSREIKHGIKNIANAFRWGERNFNPKNFDESFLRNLSFRITPELYEGKHCADYRDVGVRISGSKFTPPYPEKVRILIPEFVQNLNAHFQEEDIIGNMKTAFYAHFHLVKIHPFEDGNGRTARALQDIILSHYNFPLPIIESGERMTYYDILEDAVEGYLDKKSVGSLEISEGERKFYVYMAGKVNSSLNKIVNCLH